jgi:uncharacterized phage protein (TIGR01671 family)
MNREIRFRAWDESNKVMHFDFQFIKSGNDGNDWIIFTSDNQTLSWDKIKNDGTIHPFNNPYFQQQLHISQFTGLKDKNGKEIYESDILKISWSEWSTRGYLQSSDMTNEYEEIVTVKYKAPNFCFFLKNGKQTNLRNSATVEVIGNIYENPNLLQDAK